MPRSWPSSAAVRCTLGRPLACWLDVAGERRRLTVSPRSDPETGEVYGVAIRLAR
jgi:hypothetical protein